MRMTLDEAIKHCEEVADTPCFTDEEARCYSEHRQLAEWLKELKAYKKQSGDEELDFVPEHKKIPCTLIIGKPCGDAISRQAVLEGIRNLYPDIPIVDIMGARRKWLEKYAPYFECENVVEHLPPVTPQQMTGRWIEHFDKSGKWYECDECHTDWGGSVNYCPNCGTKMEEVKK